MRLYLHGVVSRSTLGAISVRRGAQCAFYKTRPAVKSGFSREGKNGTENTGVKIGGSYQEASNAIKDTSAKLQNSSASRGSDKDPSRVPSAKHDAYSRAEDVRHPKGKNSYPRDTDKRNDAKSLRVNLDKEHKPRQGKIGNGEKIDKKKVLRLQVAKGLSDLYDFDSEMSIPVLSPVSIGGSSVQASSSPQKVNNPFARLMAASSETSTEENKEEEADLQQEPRTGLLSPNGAINVRPQLDHALPDQFSPTYLPVYEGESSLKSDVDFAMLDYDNSYKSNIQQLQEMSDREGARFAKRPYVALVVDADQLYFLPKYLQMGQEGAKIVLSLLLNHIEKDLNVNLSVDEIRINCFCNLKGLTNFLDLGEIVSRYQFLAFVDTLQSSGIFNLFANCGEGDQAADLKVKAFLGDYVFDPNCIRIYLGGLGDHGYKAELDSLRQLNKLDRIQLLSLPEYTEQSRFYSNYSSRIVRWGSEIFVSSQEVNESSEVLVKKSLVNPDLIKERLRVRQEARRTARK